MRKEVIKWVGVVFLRLFRFALRKFCIPVSIANIECSDQWLFRSIIFPAWLRMRASFLSSEFTPSARVVCPILRIDLSSISYLVLALIIRYSLFNVIVSVSFSIRNIEKHRRKSIEKHQRKSIEKHRRKGIERLSRWILLER